MHVNIMTKGSWYIAGKKNKNKPATQAAGQTIPGATPPVGKNHPFIKIAVTFEPIQQFRCPSRFRLSDKISV